MRRNNVDLAAAGVIELLACAAIVLRMPGPVITILGIALFVAPGYMWSEVLLSRGVTAVERAVVAGGLALMVPVLGGLALYAAGIPLHRATWLVLLAAVTGIGVAVLAIQRRVTEVPALPRRTERKRLPLRHILAFGVAAIIGTGAVTLAVAGAEAQKYPGYTQLWLSPATDNPLRASLGVTNQQGSTLEYRLVLLRKRRVSATWDLTLSNGQTWERTISFTTKYSVIADLYRLPDLSHPYRVVDNGG